MTVYTLQYYIYSLTFEMHTYIQPNSAHTYIHCRIVFIHSLTIPIQLYVRTVCECMLISMNEVRMCIARKYMYEYIYCIILNLERFLSVNGTETRLCLTILLIREFNKDAI